MVTFTPASAIDFQALVEAFNNGYAGYTVPVQLEADLMQRHIRQNNIDLDASRVAQVGDEVVGVGLLARRGDQGWIGGMGVAVSHRRQGIGRQLMLALLDSAREMALRRVLLEVIEGNDAAYKLYLELGFQVTRRLLILQCVNLPAVTATVPVSMVPAAEALHFYDSFHSIPNPWQRQRESLQAFGSELMGWLAGDRENPLAYVVGRSTGRSVNLVDVGCKEDEAIALRALLAYVQKQQPGAPAQFTNLAEDDPAWPVMSTLKYEVTMSQFEMALDL